MKRLSMKSAFILLGIAILFLSFSTTPSYAKDELIFASWGGAYQEAIRKAWLQPFSKEFGVDVIEDTGPGIPSAVPAGRTSASSRHLG